MELQNKAFSQTMFEQLKTQFETYGRQQAVLMHLGILASCYERPIPKETLNFYLQILQDLTDEQMVTALDRAAKEETRFFPSPARLRELAGAETQAQSGERKAKEGLEWIMHWLRKHSIEGRPTKGKLIREGYRDPQTGRPVPDEFEWIAPDPLPDAVRATLYALGAGDAKVGAQLIAQHPILSKDLDAYPSLGLRLSAAEKLEALWIDAWRRANA